MKINKEEIIEKSKRMKETGQLRYFEDIKTGDFFQIEKGSYIWIKVSTRTAILIKFWRTFYFEKEMPVFVLKESLEGGKDEDRNIQKQ